MWHARRPEGIRWLKLTESTYNLWNQRKESLIMHGMTNSEFAEIFLHQNFGVRQYCDRSHWPDNTGTRRQGKLCNYNGNKLCRLKRIAEVGGITDDHSHPAEICINYFTCSYFCFHTVWVDFHGKKQHNCTFMGLPRTGGSLGCAPGWDTEGCEFETPTGPTLRVFK